MNRYEKLMGNTLIFAIGSFSSKLLVFLMTPFYTRILAPGDYGVSDLVVGTSNLIIPFVMLSINEAIIRYGMDRSVKKTDVLSIGVSTVITGFVIFCLFAPAFYLYKAISDYTLLVYLYVLFASLKSVVSQFIRSSGLVRLFTFDGFLNTLSTVLLNILLLVVFKMGVRGYVLSIVLANIVSIVFLTVTARLYRLLKLRHINKKLRREMYRYAIPLIPSAVFWWITSASDRFIIIYFHGEAANGLYAAAHKIPAILSLVTAIFYQAWQISAVTEYEKGKGAQRFYNDIIRYYTTLIFIASSGIVLVAKLATKIILAPAYYDAWRYIPFLILAEAFSTLVAFYASFYMVSKKSATVPLAILVGAVCNICLNLWLIPEHGAMGAAFATFVSYVLSYFVRAFDVQRLMPVNLNLLPLAFSTLIVMLQGAILLSEAKWGYAYMTGLFLLLVLINIKTVMELARGFYRKFSSLLGREV